MPHIDRIYIKTIFMITRATAMYKRLLDSRKGNGYILEVDGKPHCIAYWDAARDPEFVGEGGAYLHT